MKKAANRGTCQGCSSVQKLPDGVLAKHGYMIPAGYFQGTCQGSGHAPYELDRAFILVCIEREKDHIEHLRKLIAELKAPATVAEAWVLDYNPVLYRTVWARAGIEYTDGAFLRKTVGIAGAKAAHLYHQRIPSECGADVLKACTWLNGQRIPDLQGTIAQGEHYIAYQTRRYDEWTLKPLLSLDYEPPRGPSAKTYRQRAGYVASCPNRVTGDFNVLYKSAEAGLDVQAGRWTTVCEAHHTTCGHKDKRTAQQHLYGVPEWCELCLALERDQEERRATEELEEASA